MTDPKLLEAVKQLAEIVAVIVRESESLSEQRVTARPDEWRGRTIGSAIEDVQVELDDLAKEGKTCGHNFNQCERCDHNTLHKYYHAGNDVFEASIWRECLACGKRTYH